MRTIKIDFSSGNPRIECDSNAAGIQGEHRASELVIILPPDMPSGLSYRLAFDPGGQSDTLSLTDGELRYELPQSVTQHDAVSMTVEGYEGEARIYKSVMVELYFDAAVDTDNPVDADGHSIGAEVAANTAARHSHENKAVLDKFAESEDGKPTYDGKALGGGGASTAEEVSYTNTQLPNVENVKTALDELVPDSHTHDNKDTLDKLSVADGKLQYAGSDVGLKGDKGDTGATGPQGEPGVNGYTPVKGTDYWTAADKAEIVEELKPSQVTSGASITLADNTEYRLTDVTELTITYPDGNFECWMRLAFAADGTITVTLPSTTQYIGTTPTFANGEMWEMSIKDGIVIAGKVA